MSISPESQPMTGPTHPSHPGTASLAHLDEDLDAGEVVLASEDITALDGIATG